MSKINEYKGEKTVTQLTARLIPPNENYSDCRCELVLTKGHLFILEDNFDDTWTEHFVFPIEQIESIEAQKDTQRSKSNNSATRNAIGSLTTLFVSPLFGNAVFSRDRNVKHLKYLHVNYRNEIGNRDTIFFEDLESSAGPIEKAFAKVKENLYA